MSMVLFGWVSRLYVSKDPVRSKVAVLLAEEEVDWKRVPFHRRAGMAAVDEDDVDATDNEAAERRRR